MPDSSFHKAAGTSFQMFQRYRSTFAQPDATSAPNNLQMRMQQLGAGPLAEKCAVPHDKHQKDGPRMQKSRQTGGFSVQRNRLALGELLAPTCFVQTNFLTLNFTSISRNKAGFRQSGFQIRIVFDQSARNSVTHSSCLP